MELTLNSTQQVPWHFHSNVQDTFYVLAGQLRIVLREPQEEVRLTAGETYSVRPRRPHLVTNNGAITYGPREPLRRGRLRRMWQKLSALDFARSMHIRSNSAFCDIGVTGILQPAVHISVRYRVRSSSRGRSNG